jgi:hypothetical protein
MKTGGTSGADNAKTIGGWRKLNKEEAHNLYASPNIIRTIVVDEVCEECSTH